MERLGFGLLVLVLALAGAAVTAASGKPRVTHQPALHAVRGYDSGDWLVEPDRPLTPPLWDQYDDPSFGAMTSQDFEPVRDQWDSFGADDFVVPREVDWRIDGVDVQGFCDPPCGIESFHVRSTRTTPPRGHCRAGSSASACARLLPACRDRPTS